jgi:hypothetical protein
MAKIYISSTYSDLKDFREAAYRALRKLNHDVIAMEDYTAADQRPLDKCLADVAGCDVYVGIFAWRYGFIPTDQKKSITELEFRTAQDEEKICLLFLLDDIAPWSRALMDKDSDNIEALREELKRDFLVEFFSTKDELASDVAIAVSKSLTSGSVIPIRPLKHANSEEMNQILLVLKPIITVFLCILAVTVLSMIMCFIPPISDKVDVKLALSGLGGTSAFLICCLMFIFNKFVQIAQRGR